ncbi:50S ribosomal protein L13 [Kwoniella newhampshirensis]|uniref:50S ribosomal protein L13 n=1 Tax=Kwoniella newhampshirensis TaxID=1651941 RepID=A0AAW0Z6J3_9TREE
MSATKGKHKPTYDPAVDAGDYVVVSDALKVHLTGKKATDKMYYHHTGWMGGMRETPITRMRERRPEEPCPVCFPKTLSEIDD